MSVGVLDASVAVGWIRGGHRSADRIDKVFDASRQGKLKLVISTVNLAEVLKHTAEWSRATGGDAVALLRGAAVELVLPDEAVARRAAKLPLSLGDSFAAATVLELGGRLHTADRELVRQLKRTRFPVTAY